MNFLRHRQSRVWASLGALLLFWGLSTLRALPAYHRGTYATEGGAWLAEIWQIGFLEAVRTIRPDYCVLGNLCVIQAADLVTTLTTGDPLAPSGPFWQHTFACLYVALVFLLIFHVLRRHHGWKRALLITVVMLLAPDLDDENRIFGEANNVGFFSLLAVVFLYYDFWLSPKLTAKRLAASLALIAFHLFTSPLAGIVAAAWSALLIARILWQRAAAFRLIVFYAIPILLAGWTIWRAQHHGISAALAESATNSGVSALQPFFVDLVFCRQWLYPLTLNFYTSANDGITLSILAAVLISIGLWLWIEKRQTSPPASWHRITGLLLLSVVALCVAILTLHTRRWLLKEGVHYESLWPARYYLMQNMIMICFFGLMWFRLSDFWPRMRAAVPWLLAGMGLNAIFLQTPRLRAVLDNPQPAVDARRWPHELARTHDLHTLTGTLAASRAQKIPTLVDVPMYIDGHAIPVPSQLMDASRRPPAPSDACLIDLTERPTLEHAMAISDRRLRVENLRLIPRHRGALVMGDALLPQGPSQLGTRRRHLWIGSLPGQPMLKAYAYSVPESVATASPRKSQREFRNWLFKFVIWWDEAPPFAEIQSALGSLPIVLGETPHKPYAAGLILAPGETVPLSALRDDATCALRLQPLPEKFKWQWQPRDLKATNATLTDFAIEGVGDHRAPFEEAAYLTQNPDIAHAVTKGAITSGRAHYEALGRFENRPVATHAVSVALAPEVIALDEIAGLSIGLESIRGGTPERLRCVLHGPDGQHLALRLVPTEGLQQFAVHYLPASWLAPSFPVDRFEIQFEDAIADQKFRLSHLHLHTRP
jgi:hypothetical protein